MNSKLIIITFTGLATIGGLFLFSSNQKPEQQSASITEKIDTPTTSPSKTYAPKPKIGSPTTATPLPSQTPTSTPTAIPLPTLSSTPTTTPVPTISTTPFFTPTPTPTPKQFQQSAKININTADKQELEKITGVGPVIAQRIIDYRQTNGPFQTIEEIKEVNGIGDIKFEKMKNEITI
ncbi:MAG: helix-hairpin-helix domain-containing protein [bacterium]|nr:helix-hairpin-helix domain-containing protein [bacterium]